MSSRLRPPDDDRPAEREPPRADIREAGVAPGLEEALFRPAAVEVANARAEEGADVTPFPREEPSARRQDRAGVEAPERVPRAARHCEIERSHPSPGEQEAREGTKRARDVTDVAEEVGEGNRVERFVREGWCLGVALDEAQATIEAAACSGPRPHEHRAGDIGADDISVGLMEKIQGERARAGGHVEDTWK
jgi:hypothetical protein